MSDHPADGLNPEQRLAALHLSGPLLVEAGAGSGKTRTLTQRLVCALTPGAVAGWDPTGVEQILAITFTEKAAGEIAERVRRALRRAGRPDDARRLDAAWLSTVHGLCARLLRRHALDAGLDPAFRIVDAVESHRMTGRAFAEAAEELLGESEAGEGLFGEYGYEAVAAAARRLERALHARGLPPESLVLEPPPSAEAVWRETGVFLERMRCGWEACPSTTKEAEKQREGCELTLTALERIPAAELPPHLLAMAVWEALDKQPSPPPRDLKGAEDLLAEMRPERQRLLRAAACAATAPAAEALQGLVGRYAARFASAKSAIGGLDFDDLQLETVRLLEAHPDIAARYREQFRLVMVDEFQDTDATQLRLVRAIAGSNLCTVGDERQSIYGFRGADLDVYRDHVRVMEAEGALRVGLVENYRSHPDILAFVDAAFGTEALFGKSLLPLEAARDESDRPRLPEGEPRVEAVMLRRSGSRSIVAEEAVVIAERFATLCEAGMPPASMAVLLRTYKHAETFAGALRAHGLQALVVGGSRFFDLPEVATLRALCRALANGNDDEALGVLLASPFAGLSDDALWLIRHDSEGNRLRSALFASLRQEDSELPAADRRIAQSTVAVLERAQGRVGRMPLSEILLRALEESAWDLRLLAEGDVGKQAYANVLKFARLADAFEASGGAGPHGFVEYLDAKEESGDHEAPAALAPDGAPLVRIMSVHASKGLEFAAVALPQLGSGDGLRRDRGAVGWRADGGTIRLSLALPPSRCSRDASKTNLTAWSAEFEERAAAADEEEAKRLFYVACTRAEEKLLLVGATNPKDEPTKRSPLDWLREATAELALCGSSIPMTIERIDVDAKDDEEPAEGAPEDPMDPEAFPPAPPVERALEPAAAPERLSYSDIALWRRCSLRFWAEKVLRVGSVSSPSSETGARAFGSAVHAALQSAAEDLPLDEARLAALARRFGLSADDVSRVAHVVGRCLESDVTAEMRTHAGRRAEVPFVVPVGGGGFLLRGALDVYGRTGPDGLVIDYKTGTSGSEADLPQRFALQAACYGLVALADGCRRARVIFVRPEVETAEGPQRVEFVFAAEDREAIEAELLAEHARMAAGEYAALEVWDERTCADCPIAGGICPLAVPLRGR